MDAAEHLKRYGWRGIGHSLDLQGKGLKRPLLYSHKTDQRGLGNKITVSDQWWMKAFDESLKNFGTGKKVG
jgi:nucleolar protein TMA23